VSRFITQLKYISEVFVSVLPPIEQKSAYVNRMFDAIAERYDLLNRLMTFGLDRGWRRFAVQQVAYPYTTGPRRALDVATGTGDFLPPLHAALPDALVVGLDFSLPMMRAGDAKLEAAGTRSGYVGGDALSLPFGDNSFDAITSGFGIRNVTDIETAFREMYRVAKPGGRMACLEVAHPHNSLVRFGHQFYFNRIVPILGRIVAGNAEAYTYLPQSAQRFPPPPELSDLLRNAGWRNVSYTLLGFGAVAVHVAEK
jgi:demethylmenaquinone methyltransferase/2-methoxy-6-polyprenyl-1,4-benzoquinol methylase